MVAKISKVGIVVSDKCDKTLVVSVKYRVKNKLYKKFVTKYMKIMVHDQDNKYKVGNTVKITPCRPLSKCKRWRVVGAVQGTK